LLLDHTIFQFRGFSMHALLLISVDCMNGLFWQCQSEIRERSKWPQNHERKLRFVDGPRLALPTLLAGNNVPVRLNQEAFAKRSSSVQAVQCRWWPAFWKFGSEIVGW
jgi:hypothetical protein